MEVLPSDEHNQLLVSRTHPAGWVNPTFEGRYNLVAVGGGTAGIVAALGAATLGGRAALVERHLLGGDCLNTGCVPSKALLRAARAAWQATRGQEYGFYLGAGVSVEFPAVMQRMRRLRAGISRHDSAERFRSLGVDVYLGEAAFTGPDRLEVDGRVLRFRRAVVATGSRPAVPPIRGLAEVPYLTSESIFSLTQLPKRLVVLGSGPVGCELAQAFRRFGSEVHLVGRSERVLKKECDEAARTIQARFEREGLHLHLGWNTLTVEKMGDSISLVVERRGERRKLIADALLVAVGRRANVERLGLETAGVRYTEHGIEVNDRLQTSNRAVFAAGDVCGRQQFTHAADAMARICLANALFFARRKAGSLVIPRCTYTDPEIAHVGLTAAEAQAQGIPIDSYRVALSDVDRAVLDGEDEGFAEVHTRRGGGRVVGCTIVAAHAGEMIGEMSLLMTNKLPLAALGRTIHCYPTQVEALKRVADAYARTRLTPPLARMLAWWFKAWRR